MAANRNKITDNKCKNCKYCVESVNVNDIGHKQYNCFYGPPVPYPAQAGPGQIAVVTLRPTVNPDDWCSQWEAIETR